MKNSIKPQEAWVNAPKKLKQNGAYCPFSDDTLHVSSPLAAVHLRQGSDDILTTWMRLVRRQATDAQASAAPFVLRNFLPGLLCNLADALEDPHWQRSSARNDTIAREHGRQRYALHTYTVEQMVGEYAVLRHAVCEHMQRQHRWPEEIVTRIHAFIDAAICTATREFVAAQTQHLVQQRDAARAENDASRKDVAGLLHERQVRERFVALLTHDLRSPLTSIGMSVEILENKPGDVILTSRLLPRIHRAVRRIDHMIQDMLDASQARAGRKVPVKLTACDLVQVATDAHEDLTQTYGSRIKLRAPAVARGTWDGSALVRVIENLVGNALKYGDKDADITIAVADMQQSVRLSVHNYGHPLGEQESRGLFHPYTRTKDAEAGEQRGWGLGLAMVRGVTEAHGGQVGVVSSAETGTTFWCEYPKAPR